MLFPLSNGNFPLSKGNPNKYFCCFQCFQDPDAFNTKVLREREDRRKLESEKQSGGGTPSSGGGLGIGAKLDILVLGVAFMLLVFVLRMEYNIDVLKYAKEWVFRALDPGEDPMKHRMESDFNEDGEL